MSGQAMLIELSLHRSMPILAHSLRVFIKTTIFRDARLTFDERFELFISHRLALVQHLFEIVRRIGASRTRAYRLGLQRDRVREFTRAWRIVLHGIESATRRLRRGCGRPFEHDDNLQILYSMIYVYIFSKEQEQEKLEWHVAFVFSLQIEFTSAYQAKITHMHQQTSIDKRKKESRKKEKSKLKKHTRIWSILFSEANDNRWAHTHTHLFCISC